MSNKLIVITPEELETIFDNRLRHALEKYMPPTPTRKDNEPGEAGSPLVSKRQAAKLLGLCTSSVDNLARSGKLKRLYVGTNVRFNRQDVLGLARGHQNTKAQ